MSAIFIQTWGRRKISFLYVKERRRRQQRMEEEEEAVAAEAEEQARSRTALV
jgi:hypothetical protein